VCEHVLSPRSQGCLALSSVRLGWVSIVSSRVRQPGSEAAPAVALVAALAAAPEVVFLTVISGDSRDPRSTPPVAGTPLVAEVAAVAAVVVVGLVLFLAVVEAGSGSSGVAAPGCSGTSCIWKQRRVSSFSLHRLKGWNQALASYGPTEFNLCSPTGGERALVVEKATAAAVSLPGAARVAAARAARAHAPGAGAAAAGPVPADVPAGGVDRRGGGGKAEEEEQRESSGAFEAAEEVAGARRR
jgi:hypothetical protein